MAVWNKKSWAEQDSIKTPCLRLQYATAELMYIMEHWYWFMLLKNTLSINDLYT
jgi:hypothetical protein